MNRSRYQLGAFTLIELLVVIAIIALLVAILLPALGAAKERARTIVHMSAARQHAEAFHVYTNDYKGKIIPANMPSIFAVAFDEAGNQINGHSSELYTWRLAPYLNHDLAIIVLNKQRREKLAMLPPCQDQYCQDGREPAIAHNPSFAMSENISPTLSIKDARDNPQTPTPTNHQQLVGSKFWIESIDEVKYASKLMSFSSARNREYRLPATVGTPPTVDGFNTVLAPYDLNFLRIIDRYGAGVNTRAYTNPNVQWDPNRHAGYFGFLDLRYNSQAITAHMDGHVQMSTLDTFRDTQTWYNVDDTNWVPRARLDR